MGMGGGELGVVTALLVGNGGGGDKGGRGEVL